VVSDPARDLTTPERLGDWIVIREGRPGRWGGELRRRRIFERLAIRTHARIIEDGWYPRLLRKAARGALGNLPGPLLYPLPRRGAKPLFAASEKLRGGLLEAARRLTDPTAVAIYDDPAAQARAVGVTVDPAWAAELARRQTDTISTFRWLVAPTASFADLAGLERDRVIVGGNGTDTDRIRPGPWPEVPVVGVVSAAAPGRGIETLVDVARLARRQVPDLRVRMWLVSMSEDTEAYLAGLRRRVADEPWIEIGTAPYDGLSAALAAVTVLTILWPPHEYYDVALPVKLFDGAAAGRPQLVTPRTETAAVVRREGIGVVTSGDEPEAIAADLVTLLQDRATMEALGARARQVAETTFDWRVVGERIADEVLRREGLGAA